MPSPTRQFSEDERRRHRRASTLAAGAMLVQLVFALVLYYNIAPSPNFFRMVATGIVPVYVILAVGLYFNVRRILERKER